MYIFSCFHATETISAVDSLRVGARVLGDLGVGEEDLSWAGPCGEADLVDAAGIHEGEHLGGGELAGCEVGVDMALLEEAADFFGGQSSHVNSGWLMEETRVAHWIGPDIDDGEIKLRGIVHIDTFLRMFVLECQDSINQP